MINWLKRLFKRKKSPRQLTPKEIATQRGEAWVEIKAVHISTTDPGVGSFDIDWNPKFLADLIRHGYQMSANDTDADIVDRWFTEVCRNVALETWQQAQAINPDRRPHTRNLGDGLSEIS